MKANMTHNGWKNKATWALNLRYEEIFADMAKSQKWDDVYHLADSMECLVNELEFDDLPEHSLAREAVGEYLEQVCWEEIAEKYLEDNLSDQDAELVGEIVESLTKN